MFDFLPAPRERAVTFADPAKATSYADMMASALPTAADMATKPDAFLDGHRAAERSVRLNDLSNARALALEEAADQRIAIARDVTGVQLENPFRQGYFQEANRRIDEARARGEDIGPRGPRVIEEQRRIFTEKLDGLAETFPDKAPALQFLQPLEDQAKAMAQAADYAAEHHKGGFMATLSGGLWAARRDPLFITSLFVGGGESIAATAISRIFWNGMRQSAINVGLTALEQPSVQAWRRETGARNGLVPALETVGLSALVGFIPGAGIAALKEVHGIDAVRRLMSGRGGPDDAAMAAATFKGHLDPEAVPVLTAGENSLRADAAAAPSVPRGIHPDNHADQVRAAVNHTEAPAEMPPPDIPIVAPPRPRDQARLIDEAVPVQLGERDLVDGKPVTFERFDPRQLQADPVTFQYKGNADAEGVTDRLRAVTRWDPIASGKTIVWERADGARFIADGHQRLGLAKRLLAEDPTGPVPRLDGFLLREADGWTPADVRALAAKKNMQEGSGDALDAARVLRDRPDLLDDALPVSTPMMKNAVALARLSDEAFGMALNGVVPPNYAAAVGAMVPNRLQHAAVMADLARFNPATEREARLLIGEILSVGFRAEEQINLFGAAPATRSLMGERVRVLEAAIKTLSQDKKLFGTLAEKADAIEAAGNQLAREINAARAGDASTLSDLLVRLAQRTGPVSDALNRAAARLAEGSKAGKTAEVFLDDVRALLDRDGLSGLLASPELKPRHVAEPGTVEATRAAEDAAASHGGALDAPKPAAAAGGASAAKAAGRTPQAPHEASRAMHDFIGSQRGRSLDDLAAGAKVLQGEIAAAGEAVAGETGALFVNPGPKRPERLAEKMARKDYADAGQITDAARGGLIVDAPAQADAAAAALARHFEAQDEGWKIGRTGYVDRKVLVRGADGTIGEIQIIPARMYEVKKGGGQELYRAERSLPPGAEKEALLARSSELYSAATAELGPEWAGILERSSGPKSGSNVARQSASDMTEAVWATSEPSTSFHSPPGRVTAKAETPGSNTAGRQSQLQNVSDMERPSAENIGASRPVDKPGAPSLFDALPVAGREDGRDMRLTTRAAALDDADKSAFHADLIKSCKE